MVRGASFTSGFDIDKITHLRGVVPFVSTVISVLRVFFWPEHYHLWFSIIYYIVRHVVLNP